jgi:hypothetical protein
MSHSNEKLQSSQNNKNFFGRANEKLTKITAGTLIALGAVGLSACAPSEAQPPQPPVATETAEPTNPGVEPSSENLFNHEVPLPADLQKYADMPLGEFSQLSQQEMAPYTTWLMQYRDDFTNRYYAVSGLSQDKPMIINENSSAIELLSNHFYTLRMAYNLTEGNQQDIMSDGTCGPADIDNASKLIYSQYDNPELSISTIEKQIDNIRSLGLAVCVDTQALKGLFGGNLNDANEGDGGVLSETREVVVRSDGTEVTAVVVELESLDGLNVERIPLFIDYVTGFDGTTIAKTTLGAPIQ